MERYYPFEHKEEKTGGQTEGCRSEGRDPEEKPVSEQATGKGRRGGNSASSVVIHSGKKKYGENYRKGSGSDRSAADNPYERRQTAEKKYFDAETDLRGRRLKLPVQENTDFGSFLQTEDGKRILLPFSEQIGRPHPGDLVEVSIYEDKGGRLTATMRSPKLASGSVGVLTVAEVTKIGAFADNGMPKQVLIPFREMLHTPEAGDQVLVWLYQDKSGREAGSMRVYRHLKKVSGYQKDDRVEGFVYEVNPDLGVFVAVDDQYYGMIPIGEVFESLKYGDRISARVSRVREDGKLDLLLREKLYAAADRDAEKILKELKEKGGRLPYADRADTEVIRKTFGMSKNQFKRALGYLYKKRLVEINRESDTVTLL